MENLQVLQEQMRNDIDAYVEKVNEYAQELNHRNSVWHTRRIRSFTRIKNFKILTRVIIAGLIATAAVIIDIAILS